MNEPDPRLRTGDPIDVARMRREAAGGRDAARDRIAFAVKIAAVCALAVMVVLLIV